MASYEGLPGLNWIFRMHNVILRIFKIEDPPRKRNKVDAVFLVGLAT